MTIGTVGADRAAVIAEARRWIGTPYHHLADVRGHGVDCAMLLLRVYVDLGLVAPFDPRPYPVDWHLHRSSERYLDLLTRHCARVEAPGPGDIVMFRFGRTFSHGGIVTDWPRIIHASHPARICLEEDLTGTPFWARERQYYSYWAR